jgi:trehalose synthase
VTAREGSPIMIDFVTTRHGLALGHYAKIAVLAGPVAALRGEAARLGPRLQGRTVWMVNSTSQGGGVAEILLPMVSLLEELGVPTRWAVIGSDEARFFALTKRLHNLIHGQGDPTLSQDDREIYEAVNRENAAALKPRLKPGDIVVVHDPQPLPLGAILKRECGVTTIWRCHIGLDRHLPQTRAAWAFLQPYAETYDHAVFSASEYIPDYLSERASVIQPGIDPCGHKNRDLSPHKLVGVLCNAGLKKQYHPVLTPPFSASALRLNGSGRFEPASNDHEIGLLYRPIVTQISRWDRLKGFEPLLKGFLKLKQRVVRDGEPDGRHRHRLEIARLVLAGPDPSGVQDDPESQEVLDELTCLYRALPAEQQQDVALLKLPMDSTKENALMVNVLQRCSTVVVQNSICEGFGLTATEAMWKGVPFLGTHACGIRQQVRDRVDGILTRDPEDPEEVARNLDALLRDPMGRDVMGRSAQRRVHRRFLLFTQLQRWLEVLAGCTNRPPKTGHS